MAKSEKTWYLSMTPILLEHPLVIGSESMLCNSPGHNQES